MPFSIVRQDITKMCVDAIVNTANPNPVVGGGTDYAIYQAAGMKKLLAKRERIGMIDRGQAAITPAFNLDARYIIHTVGPVYQDGNQGEEQVLRNCYRNSLKLAVSHRCKSIAFPLISTGVYGFPKELGLQVALSEIEEFLLHHEMMVWLVVFDSVVTQLSERLLINVESYIDDRYAKDQAKAEYETDHRGAGRSPNIYHNASYQERRTSYRPSRESLIREELEANCALDSFPFDNAVERVEETSAAPEHRFEKPDLRTKASRLRASKQSKRSLENLKNFQAETFQQMLLRLIKEKGMTNTEAYKKANQDKKLFSKIKNNPDYQPKKKTALAFALALHLSLDETKDLLARAGYAFSPCSSFDYAMEYFFEHEIYDIFQVESVLFDLGLETLCNYD